MKIPLSKVGFKKEVGNLMIAHLLGHQENPGDFNLLDQGILKASNNKLAIILKNKNENSNFYKLELEPDTWTYYPDKEDVGKISNTQNQYWDYSHSPLLAVGTWIVLPNKGEIHQILNYVKDYKEFYSTAKVVSRLSGQLGTTQCKVERNQKYFVLCENEQCYFANISQGDWICSTSNDYKLYKVLNMYAEAYSCMEISWNGKELGKLETIRRAGNTIFKVKYVNGVPSYMNPGQDD